MPAHRYARSPQAALPSYLRVVLVRVCLILLAALALLPATPTLAKPPLPQLRLPLEDLGYEPPSQHVISTGASVVNVNFVDDTHLLVSFAVRRLMKRLPEDPPNDEDRTVLALLLEMPSGKVVARTEWRLHDSSQYLWNLGDGTLLLRIRNTITTIAPAVNLASPDPFQQHPFLHSNRPIQAIILSPESDFLILETSDPTPAAPYASTVAGHPMAAFDAATGTVTIADPNANPDPIQINFYRLAALPDSPGAIQARVAGVARAKNALYLPADAAGYLDVLDEGNNTWAFDFDTYTGTKKQMNLFDATCAPQPTLVSRGEFVALACVGGNQRQTLAAFNLRGDEMWQQKLFSAYTAPRFLPAPYGGRFAFARITVPNTDLNPDDLNLSVANSQIVTVFQNNSGKELLRLDCSPIQQTAENVSLAPDGMTLALVRYGAVEVYRLPPLTPQDKTAIQLAEASAPERTDASVRFQHSSQPVSNASEPSESGRTASFTPVPPNPTTGSNTSASAASATPVTEGDEAPSKPPTLYTLPTDKPHNTGDDQGSTPPR